MTLPGAHLLHAAPSHSGEGVGHQAGAQASEEPDLPIHLHDVLGWKEAEAAASRPARTPTPEWHSHPDRVPAPQYVQASVTEGSIGPGPWK